MTNENRNIPDNVADADLNLLGDPDAQGAPPDGEATGNEAEAGGADAGKDAGDAGAEAAGGTGAAVEADAGKADTVERRAHDGVMADLREERRARQEAERRIAELERIEAERQASIAAANQRDYAKELQDIEDRWENGDFDDFKAFQKERDALLVAQARDATAAEIRERDAQKLVEDNAKAWGEALADFLGDEANARYNDDPILANALGAAAQAVYEKHQGRITYDEVLKKAAEEVEARFAPPSPADATRNDRRVRQAEATANGAALPPSPASGGGLGQRGLGDGMDLSKVTRGSWDKVPQSQRDAALGKPED